MSLLAFGCVCVGGGGGQGFMAVFASHFYIMGEADRRRSVPWYDDTRISSFKEEDYGRRLATEFIRFSGSSETI